MYKKYKEYTESFKATPEWKHSSVVEYSPHKRCVPGSFPGASTNARIVKWYNSCLVSINPQFDPECGHHLY